MAEPSVHSQRPQLGGGQPPGLFPRTLLNVARRTLLRHPWQTVLMIIGITLGVAVVVAIDLANASAARAFDLSTDAVVGRATHQILAGPGGLDESIYTELRRQGIPAPIAPVVTDYVASPQLGGRPLQLLGIDPFAEGPFRSYLSAEGEVPVGALTLFFTKPGAVLLSADMAVRYGLEPGGTIILEGAGEEREALIAGVLQPADSLSRRALEGIILADVATAQEFTGRLGQLDRIDLILPEGDEGLLARIEAALPPGLRVTTVEARTGTIEQMTAAFRTNLTALSLLALVVGLFLIYNTMTFSVVQRRPLFGTLRSLGVTRREIFVMVVGEALLAGIIGAAGGLALGVVLGQGAVRLVSQTINDLYFVVTVRAVEVPVSSLIKGGVLGVMATVLAAAAPAWEAASVAPRAALLRSGLEDKAERAVGRVGIAGLALIAAGAGLLSLPGGDLIVSFGGTFAVIVGFAMLTPQVTALLMRAAAPVSGRLWGALGRMGPRDVVKSLSRTSVAVAALMIAVSVTIGVSVMVGSFRNTVELWLSQSLRGDIYISPPSVVGTQSSGTIDPAVFPILESWPGVMRVDTFRTVEVDSPLGPVNLSHTQNPTIGVERIYRWVAMDPAEVWDAMVDGAVIVSEPFANWAGLPRRDATVTVITPREPLTLSVVGVYYDYTSSQGTILMARPFYLRYWDDETVGAASLRLAPGVDPDALSRGLADALAPVQRLEVRPNAGLRADALAIFDRTFAITDAMQLLATAVAFVGVLSALLSLQLEKARELGILRAVGLTVRQLWGLVMLQTGLMGGVAGLLALPTGLALSLILIYIINKRAFGWTLQLYVEPAPFALALVIALLAALLAGLYPARRIGRMVAAEAMRYE
jgi:putative ABC transport system permease protein